ncbi:EAL domain-containing protein [Thiorhodococcus mannitoliphagus]|uniref:EAL domain-containing protein n=1 Tax=Thiorhodococcus mannitoliphagus TaxID=329406 RepID=A0A6P1E1L3_9GAMM|nr:EAL domain-containing protein [Thiorhodococcus mannitoliphagus]NEX23113.1 EAL domain-containing protein [Thiorhodococcus mannitoliphagus]
MSDSREPHQPESESAPQQEPDLHYIVGIGASAGGLEALTLLIGALPAGLNCTFVIAQHLSPNYRSMLVQLIGRETDMPVKAVEDGEIPLPGTIYISPPKWNLLLREGRFVLEEPRPDIGPRPSVNLFLKSLAETKGESAMGVILSGTGSDGTLGMRAIKANGGITFAQDPGSAKYPGMPQSAINAVEVDYVLPPANIAHEISLLVHRVATMPSAFPDETDSQRLTRLLLEVRRRTKIDFSGYKESTLWRRVRRRMATQGAEGLEAYVEFATDHPEELERLAKDILISVTAFFRDAEPFRQLETALARLLETKRKGAELRIWVPGCATGEEAYSIAIVLAELLGRDGLRDLRIQIFATDIDMEALTLARRAMFPVAALIDLPETLVSRYFEPVGDQYQIVKEIRDLVVFARQDLALDPPFLRLDLVSCRNLLIYFATDLQAKVLSVMHYSLRTDGLLFLGRSENISQQDALFESLDAKARLFRPKGGAANHDVARTLRGHLGAIVGKQAVEPTESVNGLFKQLAFQAYVPPSVLLDDRLYVIHTQGDLSPYIQLPDGAPRLEFPNMLSKELRTELLTLVHYSRTKRKSAKGRQRRVAPGRAGLIRLSVNPHHPYEPDEMFLVSFEPQTPPRRAGSRSTHLDMDMRVLEDELIATREHLQTVIQELETSNEEMQALNEEVQASNEELQASNEELEASNEELQASNEELVTVNEELMVKSAELAALNADFESVQNSVDFPLVVLDTQLHLTRFNRAAERVMQLTANCHHRPFKNLRLPAAFADLPAEAERVLHEGETIHRTLQNADADYRLQIVPYTDHAGESRGVVIGLADQTETARAERQALELQRRLLDVMNQAASMFAVKDQTGAYEFANQPFLDFFGLTLAQIIGRTDYQIFDTQLADLLQTKDLEVLRRRCAVDSEEQVSIGDSIRYLKVTRFPLVDGGGKMTAICSQALDTTSQHAAEEGLRLAASVFRFAGEGICVTDPEGKILSVNESFSRITGYPPEAAIGHTPALLRSDRHPPEFYTEMWRTLNSQGMWQGEIWNKCADGTVIPKWLTINAVRNDQGALCNYVGIFSDISAIKQSHEQIEYLATHDELTGLPNRNLFDDRVKHAITRAGRSGERLYVLFVDLDNFKLINDNLGHAAGDELLIEVAARMRASLREQDTVARLGGDEFILLVEDNSADLVSLTAKRLVDVLSASFRVHGQDIFVSASVGVSVYPDDGADSETLLKNADTAMYKAKDQGKNQLQFFSVDMKLLAERRLTIETGIRVALAKGQFELAYQPEVDLATGRVVGAEALIRWESDLLGSIPPSQFIPIAEQSGLIVAVSEWVIERVFHDLRQWREQGLELVPVFINISPLQFRTDHLISCIKAQAAHHDLSPSNVGVEITEGAIMDRNDAVLQVLGDLKRLNISIFVDDFGTGYSSLTYLKRYPIDGLKIDQSFVDGIANETDDQAIATAVIGIARAMGIKVVAEGVETIQQRDALISRDCELAQGFLLHRPLSFEAFGALLPRVE